MLRERNNARARLVDGETNARVKYRSNRVGFVLFTGASGR